MADLVIAGAGMAGLVAAAEARQRGADVLVHEKRDQAGGSMGLSSGVIWRHRDLERFRADCPGGEADLQRAIFERLDADLDWLTSLGAPIAQRSTGNPLTAGARFDPPKLVAALLRAAGDSVEYEAPLRELPGDAPLILATGGFPACRELLREHVTDQAEHVMVRAAPGGTGDGLRLGVEAGARSARGIAEIYGRNMPAPPAHVDPSDFVATTQLYARHATVTNERGDEFAAHTWSEIDVVQWTARQPRARAWFRVSEQSMNETVRERTVADMVAAARSAGAPVRREGTSCIVETVAGVTSTLGGLAIDAHGRAADGIYAAGDDAGGIATGGYASGLAASLVFGRLAAAAALGQERSG